MDEHVVPYTALKRAHRQRTYLKGPTSPLHGDVQGPRPGRVIHPHAQPHFQPPRPLPQVVRVPSSHAPCAHHGRGRLVDDGRAWRGSGEAGSRVRQSWGYAPTWWNAYMPPSHVVDMSLLTPSAKWPTRRLQHTCANAPPELPHPPDAKATHPQDPGDTPYLPLQPLSWLRISTHSKRRGRDFSVGSRGHVDFVVMAMRVSLRSSVLFVRVSMVVE